MTLPIPSSGETEDSFLNRFYNDADVCATYPEVRNRVRAALECFRNRKDIDDDIIDGIIKSMSEPAKPRGMKNSTTRGQTGKPVAIRFIEPGLVFYEHLNDGKGGTVLVRKETLEKMNASMAGRPIFNWTHKSVSNTDFTEGKAHGVLVNDSKFNPHDGWFYVTGLVWDDETIENIKKGHSVSCAYDVTEWGPGGVYHNIPYDAEVLNGEYTHIAVVDSPRYENAKILLNQGGHMRLKFWQKDNAGEEKASEVELANAKVQIGDRDVPLADLIEHHKKIENAKLLNSMSDSQVIEIDGKKVTLGDLKNSFTASLRNADDEKEKEDKKEKKDEEARNEADEKEKKEKEEEAKNAKNQKDHEDGEHDDKPMENCKGCQKDLRNSGYKSFQELDNAAKERKGNFKLPELRTLQERVQLGNDRYGPKAA